MTDLAERYGTPRPVRRGLLLAAVGVLAVAALGWLVWAMLFHSRPLAQSEIVSFQVNSEHSATATMTVVRRTDDVKASCLLRAQAEDHSTVGELNVTVDSSEPTTATITETIRTERRATSVMVVGCVADGQPQRR